jgi:Na+-driven multidrug efflux pump
MIKINLKDIRIHKKELLDSLHIGIPAGLQQSLYSIANVVISAAVNSVGADATTGISIANTFDGILYQIATAPALAVMPYVSQNLGAGNLKRAKQAIFRGMMIAAVMAGSLGALSAIFSGPLSSIMAENATQIAYSQQKMMIISSTYFICGINNILSETMRGFRRPLIPTVATMIYMCLLRFVWVWWIFPHYPNLTFLYLV